MTATSIVLVDTMIVIEAVDTGCWNAITGQLRVATSAECTEELRRGDVSNPRYVAVGEADIGRAGILDVSSEAKVALRLRYPDAHRLDAGERDLLALATDLSDPFELCSCDKAAVAAAHALGCLDQLVSLEGLAKRVGARARRPFRRQFTEQVMRTWRTSFLLGRSL